MQKQISIPYQLVIDNSSVIVLLFYTIAREGDELLLNCYVEGAYPNDIGWLHVNKFQVRATRSDQGYMLLFDNQSDTLSYDGCLFIELAYASIMKREKIKMVIPELQTA